MSDGELFLAVPHLNRPDQAKHYQHFSFGSLRQILEPHFHIRSMEGFARESRLYRLAKRPIMNSRWVFTMEAPTRFLVNQLARTHASESGASRICAIAVRKD